MGTTTGPGSEQARRDGDDVDPDDERDEGVSTCSVGGKLSDTAVFSSSTSSVTASIDPAIWLARTHTSFVLWLMSLSVGGLSLLSPWTPVPIWGQSMHNKPGFRSFICALVFLAVALILAYLTNPTEISFRSYLTEQSFRQHLSHLDDLADDSTAELDSSSSRSCTHGSDRKPTVDRTTLPFHFANRASVSLRTPKHVLHSFGICTIATTRGAAVPVNGRCSNITHNHLSHRSELDAFVSSDFWFIGAFGRWWRGGLVDSWHYDALIRSKDVQGWSSGILGFKALDQFHDYEGLSFAKLTPCPRPSSRGSPPKLRNRERSTQRSGTTLHRNSSPPPLPKSASLPLHADHRHHDFLPVTPQLSSHSMMDQKHIAVHAPPIARSSSAPGTSDHSPTIAEVLRQISAAQSSIHDLQNQFQEAQNVANQSRDLLEIELGDLRSRRREDDQKRLDGRARTKTLEEARRLAETNKREAEKKKKIARSAKDSAMRRVEELELEIQRLKERMAYDLGVLTTESEDPNTVEGQELICELERKRKEVRVAEEVVLALNTRARELEEKIDQSKSRLRTAQHRGQLHKAYLESTDPSYLSVGNDSVIHQSNYGRTDNSTWPSSYNPFDVPVDDVLASSMRSEHVRCDTGSEPRDTLHPSEHVGLSSVLRAQGYTILNDDPSCVDSTLPPCSDHGHNGYFQPGQVASFSPFCDPPTPSAAFIPSSLISVLDSPSADWRGSSGMQGGALTSSPVRHIGRSLEIEPEQDLSDLCRAQEESGPDLLPTCNDTTAQETLAPGIGLQEAARKGKETTSKGLFSFSRNEKHRSNLNPDAKVFHLTRPTSDRAGSADMSTPSAPSYDALNPTGLTPSITSSGHSLLRAFAPSRAEREALQRALGGSTNASLERLLSLSDVESIPSSPVRVHTETQGKGVGEKDCALPVWLQSSPLVRKPNFSPWEDEEPVFAGVKET